MLRQNDLTPPPGAKRARKRVGRGLGSGHGRFSGRGQKGRRGELGRVFTRILKAASYPCTDDCRESGVSLTSSKPSIRWSTSAS